MAIVTGSHKETLLLMHRSTGLLNYFDQIITEENYSNPKPHPEPYLNAMKALNINAIDCIAIEDSVRGFNSAKSAGVSCIVVPTNLTQTLDFPNALAIEKDVSGVHKYIQFN